MKYIIAGFGKFGRLALERLASSSSDHELVVVDSEADLSSLEGLPRVSSTQDDAVHYLLRSESLEPDDIVIPMVPFHLAAAYLLAGHSAMTEAHLPQSLLERLSNPFQINDSTICCSMADFVCPDDCPEGDRCTVTGELRKRALYEEMGELEIPGFRVQVLRSHQIQPGVGGYPFHELKELGNQLEPGHYIIATACNCHGILSGVEIPETSAGDSIITRPLA